MMTYMTGLTATGKQFKVSVEDVELLRYPWHSNENAHKGNRYPSRHSHWEGKRRFRKRLHVEVAERASIRKSGLLVDHINRDILDARRNNLRALTNQQNCLNRKVSVVNKSGVTGVYFEASPYPRWRAAFGERTKSYKTKEEAVAARMIWEQENLPK